MLGLAIDSADRTASAALWTHDAARRDANPLALLAFETLPPEAGKADQLITVIERLFGQHKLDYADLDVIAVNRGPGSFTGIRSAVALGRGLALAAGLPVLGVTTHEALAARLDRKQIEDRLLIAQDARRGEIYTQTFGPDGAPRSEIEAKTPTSAADDLREQAGRTGSWVLVGSGAELVADLLGDTEDARFDVLDVPPVNASAVAHAAAARMSAGKAPTEGFALKPLYIRAPDASPPAPLISTSAASEVAI